MSSGLGFVVTSGDHHYDGTRHFTSPQPGAPTPRDSPLDGVILDQIGGGTIQITENGSVALIPLLKAAGLEIPQLPTDPALRVRTLHAMWIAVLSILSKKGRAGLEAKNRNIEVPRIVQMNPETMAKFRALRVEVVGGRPVRVPTGRNTSTPSDDVSKGDSESRLPSLILDPVDAADCVRNLELDNRLQMPPDSSKTTPQNSILGESTTGVRDLGIPTPTLRPTDHRSLQAPSPPEQGQLPVIPTDPRGPSGLPAQRDGASGGGGSREFQGRSPVVSGNSRDLMPLTARPICRSTSGNGEQNIAASAEQSKAYYDEVKWDPAHSMSNQSIIPHSTTDVRPPPGFQIVPPHYDANVGRSRDHLTIEGQLISQKGGRGAGPQRPGIYPAATRVPNPSPSEGGIERFGARAAPATTVSEMSTGPQYRILQRKKPEDELKISGVGSLQSDPTEQVLDSSAKNPSTVRGDGWTSEGAKTSPMSDTQLGRQVLLYIKSQSDGQLEGRAIGAVAKNIYNSYREVAVHKSRDPNLLDRIEKVIVQLGQSNQIQLGINGKRFPIQIPSNLHPPRGEQLRHRFSVSEIEQIYREHREGLSQVNSFNAAARILANSSIRWKQLDRNVAEQLAAAAVAQLIENNLFR